MFFSDSVKVPSNLYKAMYTEIDCHETVIKVIKPVVFPNLFLFSLSNTTYCEWADLFIQLNCIETVRITKDFPECFAGKRLFAPPKKTLTLLQQCSYISNLELNHINIKDNLSMVNRLKYLIFNWWVFRLWLQHFLIVLGFFLGFFLRGKVIFACFCFCFPLDLFLETGQRIQVMNKFIAISDKSGVWDRTLSLAGLTYIQVIF